MLFNFKQSKYVNPYKFIEGDFTLVLSNTQKGQSTILDSDWQF